VDVDGIRSKVRSEFDELIRQKPSNLIESEELPVKRRKAPEF